jgi:DNA end-binding protein Ku
MVDAVTGDVVETEEQIKGYAIGKDQYVQVEDDELASIAIESSHTVDIEKFVPKSSIDDRYRDTPYYLAPEDKVGQEAFAVIRDAMRKKKMVGIARVVMARRERVMMLEPFGTPSSRLRARSDRISSPPSWCTLGMPFFKRRTWTSPCEKSI